MDVDIERIVKEGGLPERAVFFLESIGDQFLEFGRHTPGEAFCELAVAAEIAKRYQDSVGALRLIDNSVFEYLRRAEKRFNNVGSLNGLNDYEAKLFGVGVSLNLGGLKERIESKLYGVESRPLPAPRAGPKEDDASPMAKRCY